MTTALLIIDVQHALCVGDEAAFDIDKVIERINGLSAQARSLGLPVVLIQHEEEGGTLQFGSDGWQLASNLVAAPPSDLRVRKKSANSFYRTGLQDLLQQRGVKRLVICGLQSDFCVDTTTRAARGLDYDVVLAADAHSTADNGLLQAAQITAHHNQTLKYMGGFSGRIDVVPASEVSFER